MNNKLYSHPSFESIKRQDRIDTASKQLFARD